MAGAPEFAQYIISSSVSYLQNIPILIEDDTKITADVVFKKAATTQSITTLPVFVIRNASEAGTFFNTGAGGYGIQFAFSCNQISVANHLQESVLSNTNYRFVLSKSGMEINGVSHPNTLPVSSSLFGNRTLRCLFTRGTQYTACSKLDIISQNFNMQLRPYKWLGKVGLYDIVSNKFYCDVVGSMRVSNTLW